MLSGDDVSMELSAYGPPFARQPLGENKTHRETAFAAFSLAQTGESIHSLRLLKLFGIPHNHKGLIPAMFHSC